MSKGVNLSLRKIILERDSFTCQKCKLEDKTGKLLEVHHINPLFSDGEDEVNNLILLCLDCHHYAPNDKEEFKDYMKEECTGTMTLLINSINKVKKEHPELF